MDVPEPAGDPISLEIDPTVPHAARVYDYMLGGDVNFAADRAAAAHAAAEVGGMDNVRAEVRANRHFLGRAIRYAADEGIRQFLDVGTGIPNADNVHNVARQLVPDARVVYVDKDPIVLAHAHELLRHAGDSVVYLQADFSDPEDIRDRAAKTLEFSEPVAVLLVGLLHHFTDDEDPRALVRRMTRDLAPGSLVILSHIAADIEQEKVMLAAEQLEQMNVPFVPRGLAEVADLAAGMEFVEPGMVQVDAWRPDGTEPPKSPDYHNPLYAGIARITGN
jgi:hypothetical protein